MASSSLSTFLDVTRAASGGSVPAPSTIEADSDFIAQAAKVLATINAGAEDTSELAERTGLDTSRLFAALSWLADAGMVKLDTNRVELTEPTKAALRRSAMKVAASPS